MLARMLVGRLACALLVALAGCGPSRLPTPRLGPHVGEEPATVPYPPPAGKVEVIPTPPAGLKTPVWVDGEWAWSGRRWQWRAGRWWEPPAESYYAPPLLLRLSDGTLVYFNGGWKKDTARSWPAPAQGAGSPHGPGS